MSMGRNRFDQGHDERAPFVATLLVDKWLGHETSVDCQVIGEFGDLSSLATMSILHTECLVQQMNEQLCPRNN